MIETIHTSAFFPTSGATLSANFQPQSGITAVVGENGAGKTFLTIEATRWLLYGKAALRGAASDYKDAKAVGSFLIRGARYQISRGKEEWIKDSSGATVAKGAEKVTEFVTELMGYGLDVFDLCNAATQGNVQKLGDMRPAERKAIIDKVLRLTDAEKAERDCREEAKGYRREAETLTKMLRAPGDEPRRPQDDPDALRERLTAARRLRDQHQALRGRLRAVEAPERPPVADYSEDTIAELEQYVDEQRDLHRRHRDLTIAANAFSYSAEQLDVAELRAAYHARGVKPTMAIGDVMAQMDVWDEIAWTSKINRETVTCPKCDHAFRTGRDVPAEPAISRAELNRQLAEHRAWDGHMDDVLPDGPDVTGAVLLNARRAVEARIELAALPPLGADRQAQLNAMRQDKATFEAYTVALMNYDRTRLVNAEIEAEIAKLDGPLSEQEIDDLVDDVRTADLQVAARTAWEREEVAFKETQAKIVEASRLAEEFKLGAQGITDARALIKAMIAPKISRIASALLADMTMGKLTGLVVDDEMEITVGGQRIETLSGAGKTVANLALRVAMGRALVGHTFPVFLADEIDGDLSVKRREATLQALVSLKQHMSQIILVTHRGAEIADHTFNLTV